MAQTTEKCHYWVVANCPPEHENWTSKYDYQHGFALVGHTHVLLKGNQSETFHSSTMHYRIFKAPQCSVFESGRWTGSWETQGYALSEAQAFDFELKDTEALKDGALLSMRGLPIIKAMLAGTCAIQDCKRKRNELLPKQTRRRFNNAQEQLQAAIAQLETNTVGSPSRALAAAASSGVCTRGVKVPIQEMLTSYEHKQLPSLADFLLKPNPSGRTDWLKPGLQYLSTDLVLAACAVLEQLRVKALLTWQSGAASNFRIGTVREVEHKRSDGQTVTRLLLRGNSTSTTKSRAMWVASPDVLRSKQVGAFASGSMHFCFAVTNIAETQLSIMPPLDKTFKDNDEVCTVSLADLHEYLFMYKIIEILVRETRNFEAGKVLCSPSPSLPVAEPQSNITMRTWLGLPRTPGEKPEAFTRSLVLEEILGPCQERTALLDFGRELWGFDFSSGQKEIFQSICGAVTVVETFAGGAKTTLLVTLVVWILKQCPDVVVFVAAPSKRAAGDLVDRVMKKMNSNKENGQRIAIKMGFDKVNGCDLFEEHLHEIRTRVFERYNSFYTEFDEAIFDVESYLYLSGLSTDDIKKAYKILTSLLAVRFEHLETLVYPETILEQEKVFKSVGCIGLSGTCLAKVNAGDSRRWSGKCLLGRKMLLLMDEFQNESMEKVFVELYGFHAAVLVGDWRQAPKNQIDCERQRQPFDSVDSGGNEHRGHFTAPLKSHLAWQWTQENPAVQRIESNETFRTYEPALTVIKEIFGDMLNTCCVAKIKRQSPETYFLPVLMADLRDWTMNASGEKVCSLILFRAIAVVLALEIVTSMCSEETYLIAVSCFLLAPLEALKQYLNVALPALCSRLAQEHHKRVLPACKWSVSELIRSGILLFAGPLDIGGVDACVSVPLFLKRNYSDKGYCGLMTKPYLVYSALTRGSRRIYPFVEDIRWDRDCVISDKSNFAKKDNTYGIKTEARVSNGLEDAWIKKQVLLFRCCECFSKLLENWKANRWLSSRPATHWFTDIPSVLTTDHFRKFINVSEDDLQSLMGAEAQNTMEFELKMEKLQRVAGDATFEAFFKDFDVDDHVSSLNNASDPSSRDPVLNRFKLSAPTKPTQLFLQGFWRNLAIDAVALAICEGRAVVQVPLAAGGPKQQELAMELPMNDYDRDWSHPSFLCGFLAEKLMDRLADSEYGREMAGQGFELRKGMRPHKNDRIEAGDELYFIPLCGTDRAAYFIEAIKGTERKELLHFYPCMGLDRAHRMQQVLLGRCKGQLDIAANLMVIVLETLKLHYRPKLVTYFVSDEKKAVLKAEWSALEHNFSDKADARSLTMKEDIDVEEARILQHVRNHLSERRQLPADSPSALVINEPQPTEGISGQYVHLQEQIPAVEVIRGLLAGTLDEVLSEHFMRERGVTHVLCLLGQDQLHLAKKNRCQHIFYLDWPIGYVPAWNEYPSVLRGLDTVLQNRDNKVLVHCKDGQYRTALLLFMYLVCCKRFADDKALKLIEQKKDSRGAAWMSVVGCDMYNHFCKVRHASGGILPDPLQQMLWQKGGS